MTNTVNGSKHDALVLQTESSFTDRSALNAAKSFDGISSKTLRNVKSVKSVSFKNVSQAADNRDFQRVGILNDNTTSRNLSGYSR